jgi:hypothetical protein
MEPFFSGGSVHGGFARGVLALWPCLRILLKGALRGYSVCDMTEIDRLVHQCSLAQPAALGAAAPAPVRPGPGMEGLYITGHSLGGALAVLTTVAILQDPDLAPVRKVLRGVYTYGQPMVGDATFAKRFEHDVGDMLFRHVYERDIVPMLPPRTMGKFHHIGQEYTATDGGWVPEYRPVNQLITGGLSTVAGILAWVKDQLPFLSWVPTYVSWGDHSPLNYLRTSLKAAPGTDLF